MTELRTIILLCSLATFSVCSPMGHAQVRQLPSEQVSWVTESTTLLDEATVTLVETTIADASESTDEHNTAFFTPFLIQPPPLPDLPPVLDSSSPSVVTDTDTISDTVTSFVSASPVTVTLSASPTTITATVTVSDVSNPSTWAAPAQFTDLNTFKVMHFACGQDNLQIVGDVPPDEPDVNLAVNLGDIAAALNSSLPQGAPLNASSAVLQLYYPTNSVNPGNSPQGGADFYATPLDLSAASNVTMEYSVYFPVDFQWAKGGKLPGLYGGHMTCSGGDDATSCFSTRMMWRADGAGELYLYAPKDKQTDALCHAPPKSVCDAAYGLSVGRGSFSFVPGAWTNIKQTVALNTPGVQDGGFRLEVNGQLIMDRTDVFYRDVPPPLPTTTTADDGSAPTSTSSGDDSDSDDGGLLSPIFGTGGILGPLGLGNITRNQKDVDYPMDERPPLLPTPMPNSALSATDDAAAALMSDVTSSLYTSIESSDTSTVTVVDQPTVTISSFIFPSPSVDAQKDQVSANTDSPSQDPNAPQPIGFSGLFFSTFFGGSSPDYASPADQYSWFKDFSITINS